MFTVKVVSFDGYETITQVKWYSYSKKANIFFGYFAGRANDAVCDTDECLTIDSGTIYVMNEQGKTVSSYFLDVPRNVDVV